MRQIAQIDESNSMLTPSRLLGSQTRRGSTTTTTMAFTDTSSEFEGAVSSLKRRERKKLKKSGNGPAKDLNIMESFPKEELDFVSEAIHLSKYESKGAWEGTYVYDHRQPEAEDRATIDNADAEDIQDIQSVISSIDSLSVKDPFDMTPRQRKILKKYTNPIDHSSFRGGSRKFTPQSSRTDPFNGVDPAIFFRLGVEVENPVKNSRPRKDLIVKLVAAVKEDIDIISREEEETKMREEGFWRWAGRAAYHAIMETRKELDWATGQKKGAPRAESLYDHADDEMYLEELEELEEAVAEKVEPTVQTAPKNVETVSAPQKPTHKAEISHLPTSFQPRILRILPPKPIITAKSFSSSKSNVKLRQLHEESEGFTDDEGAEDLREMVKRYESPRSILEFARPFVPNKRGGGWASRSISRVFEEDD